MRGKRKAKGRGGRVGMREGNSERGKGEETMGKYMPISHPQMLLTTAVTAATVCAA